MFAELSPRSVVCVEVFGDVDAPLYPEETAAIEGAIPSRQREFATTRECARRALAVLGRPPVPIPIGADRAPVWPPGIVGSMTHCDGLRAAAVSERCRSIGIDAEPAAPLPDGVLGLIASETEVAGFPSGSDVPWDRLLFSIKESVYKAWYPLAGRWLGFTDADVAIDPDGTFRVRLLVPGPSGIDGGTGRWAAADGLLATMITVGG
jgi:4'-phosphopantetheinyl transferase EntD